MTRVKNVVLSDLARSPAETANYELNLVINRELFAMRTATDNIKARATNLRDNMDDLLARLAAQDTLLEAASLGEVQNAGLEIDREVVRLVAHREAFLALVELQKKMKALEIL